MYVSLHYSKVNDYTDEGRTVMAKQTPVVNELLCIYRKV